MTPGMVHSSRLTIRDKGSIVDDSYDSEDGAQGFCHSIHSMPKVWHLSPLKTRDRTQDCQSKWTGLGTEGRTGLETSLRGLDEAMPSHVEGMRPYYRNTGKGLQPVGCPALEASSEYWTL